MKPMNAKTKATLAGTAAFVLAALGLTMCSDNSEAPKSPEALIQTKLYECSGFFESTAQGTPNMPMDIRQESQTMAVNIYDLAGSFPLESDIGDSMDAGRKQAEEYIQKGNRKGVVEYMSTCKDVVQSAQVHLKDLRGTMTKGIQEQEQKAQEQKEPQEAQEAQKIQELKLQKEQYTKGLYQCAGIFMYNASNVDGITQRNKDTQKQLGMNTFKLAQMLNTNGTVDAKIQGMNGAQTADTYVKDGNVQGLKEEMLDCQRSIQYVMSHKEEFNL